MSKQKDIDIIITDIDQIVKSDYQTRPFLNGAQRRNYRQQTTAPPDWVRGTFTPIAPPEEREPQIMTAADFIRGLRIYFDDVCESMGRPMREMTAVNGSHIQSRFYIHANNRVRLYNIVRCILGDTSGDYDTRKGIYLMGDNGTGKSFLMEHLFKAITSLSYYYDNLRPISQNTYNALYERTRKANDLTIISDLTGSFYIDDYVYQRRYDAKIYGNTDRISDLIITRCYDLYKQGHRTYLTSNYGPKYLYENGMIEKGSYDRCMEMYNLVNWEGESMRK